MDKMEYKVIEWQLMQLYLRLQRQVPVLHDLSFHISTYDSGKTELHGFIHIGGGCESFNSIDGLISVVSKEAEIFLKREILFRKFN